jgi:hypothetical protein
MTSLRLYYQQLILTSLLTTSFNTSLVTLCLVREGVNHAGKKESILSEAEKLREEVAAMRLLFPDLVSSE